MSRPVARQAEHCPRSRHPAVRASFAAALREAVEELRLEHDESCYQRFGVLTDCECDAKNATVDNILAAIARVEAEGA